MYAMPASTARQEFAQVIAAAQRAPVTIRRQKRDVAVVMSPDEYQRLVHLNVAEFQRFCDQVGGKAKKLGMTGDVLDGLLRGDERP